MPPSKARKRARSPTLSLDESEQEDSSSKLAVATTMASAGRPGGKRSRAVNGNGSSNGSNSRDWSKTARANEVDRVRQYLSSFQNQVTAARDQAMQTVRKAEARQRAAQTAFCEKLRGTGVEEEMEKKEKRKEEEQKMAFCAEACKAQECVAPHTKHPLHLASREVLGLLQAMLESYEQTNAKLKRGGGGGGGNSSSNGSNGSNGSSNKDNTGSDGIPDAAWDKDWAEARKLLRYGRVYGDSLVHDIIVPGGDNSTQNGDGDLDNPESILAQRLSQTGRSAIRLFARSRAVLAQGDTWGEAARTQMKALTGLVKTLPTDGGHKAVSFEI